MIEPAENALAVISPESRVQNGVSEITLRVHHLAGSSGSAMDVLIKDDIMDLLVVETNEDIEVIENKVLSNVQKHVLLGESNVTKELFLICFNTDGNNYELHYSVEPTDRITKSVNYRNFSVTYNSISQREKLYPDVSYAFSNISGEVCSILVSLENFWFKSVLLG